MKVNKLETDRLILDQGTYNDYKKVYEYDMTKLRDIAGENILVKYDNDEVIIDMSKPNNNKNEYDYIIYLEENMIPIGNIIADRYNYDLNSIELAFNLHPDYWGMGYMYETVNKLIEYLFEIGYDNIICGYSEGNIKSKRLIEKLGFMFKNKIENSWIKNGINITDYEYIMSKDMYIENNNKNKIKV